MSNPQGPSEYSLCSLLAVGQGPVPGSASGRRVGKGRGHAVGHTWGVGGGPLSRQDPHGEPGRRWATTPHPSPIKTHLFWKRDTQSAVNRPQARLGASADTRTGSTPADGEAVASVGQESDWSGGGDRPQGGGEQHSGPGCRRGRSRPPVGTDPGTADTQARRGLSHRRPRGCTRPRCRDTEAEASAPSEVCLLEAGRRGQESKRAT